MNNNLMPGPLRNDLHHQGLMSILNHFSQKIDFSKFLFYWLDTVDEKYLPYLAWHFHILGNEGWDLCKTIQQKRDLLKNSYYLHLVKGSLYAVKRVFNILGIDAVVRRWYEVGLPPYHLQIDLNVTDRGLSEKLINRLDSLIKEYKAVRTWYYLKAYLTSKNYVYFANTHNIGETITVYPYQITTISQTSTHYISLGNYDIDIITIYPWR